MRAGRVSLLFNQNKQWQCASKADVERVRELVAKANKVGVYLVNIVKIYF